MKLNELVLLFEYYLNDSKNHSLFVNEKLRGKKFKITAEDRDTHVGYNVYTIDNDIATFITSDMIFVRNEDNIFQLCDELILGINNGCPVQGYNFLIPSLTSAYHDVDTIMFHSMFECVRIFVEEEKGIEVIDWSRDKHIADEIEYLYNWFKSNCNDSDLEPSVINEHMIRCVKIREYLWS